MRVGSHSTASPTNAATAFGLALTETDQLFFAQDSRVASDCFLFFFNTQGLVAIDILPEKSTITASYYTQVVLPKVVGKIHEQRPTVGTQRTLLLHDNASAHKAKVTTTFLSEQGIQVLDHPPYSPDLAPCDFWLFPVLKEKLAGRKFDRVQDLAKAVRSELSGLPKTDYQRALENWRRRLELCIRANGEYFEGM